MLALPFDLVFIANEPGYALLIAIVSPLATLIILGPFLYVPGLKWLCGVLAGTAAILFFSWARDVGRTLFFAVLAG
ncbi:hypothetical protein I5080_02750 [Salmonella enterica]|nr:hypothetical protein I5080_02750 [Salmonella enterica]